MKVGVAIYSLMGRLQEDYLGTLEELAKRDCRLIEYVATPLDASGDPVVSAEAIGQKVRELGLTPISSHVQFDDEESMKRTIETNLMMGAPRLVMPFAFMNTLEEIKVLAEKCNRMGELSKASGLEFYYHNHMQEFVKVEDGRYALEAFMAETDPSLVSMQLDAYWVKRAGEDPLVWLDKLSDRIHMIHQKDLAKTADPVNLLSLIEPPISFENFFGLAKSGVMKPDDFVAVGEGVLDVPAIVEAGKKIDVHHIIVELDNLNDFDAIEQSVKYLQALV